MSDNTNSGMMTKIRALLDKADASTFPAEQAAFRAKAEELMAKYRIEQEDLLAKDQFVEAPGRFDIGLASRHSLFVNHYILIFQDIARHTGIKVFFEWDWQGDKRVAMARGAGYEADVRYAEMLFTSARLVFEERVEPQLKPELSEQVNAYRLRSAGITRVRVAQIMNLTPGKVGSLYKKECDARGEQVMLEGRGVSGTTYRENYAMSFVDKFNRRMRAAQDMAGTAGGGLVLHGRDAKITEAYYTIFPERKPRAPLPSASAGAVATTTKAAAKAPKYRVSKKDPYSQAAMRGRQAGEAAARSVQLNRGGTDSIGGA